MKKTILTLAIVITSIALYAQVKISTGGGNPHGSSMFEVESNNKGFLPPRVANPTTIDSPAVGLQVYNTTTNCINIFNGTNWLELCPTLRGTITALSCGTITNNGSLFPNIAASGVNSVLSYTGGNGGVYNMQTVASTGVTGLTATLTAGTLAVGSGTLTYTITGTPSAEGTASFALTFGGQTCTLNRVVQFVCGTGTVTFTYNGTSVTYGTIQRAYGGSVGTKCWMDRNLGATQVANSLTDFNAYGDLWQWGRGNDGHQQMNWTGSTNGFPVNSNTSTASNSDNPGHSHYISGTGQAYSYSYYYWYSLTQDDWRWPQNPNLWQGVSGTNNPCPSGWRIPTKQEWQAELTSWGANPSASQPFNSLKLTTPGSRRFVRDNSFGTFDNIGIVGYYWSSTVENQNSWSPPLYGSSILTINATQSNAAGLGTSYRGTANSVRCIKD